MIAERLVGVFLTLSRVLAADRHHLAEVAGSILIADQIGAIRGALLHSLRTQAFAATCLNSTDAIEQYLSASLSHQKAEEFHVLFLNATFHVVHEERMNSGSLAEVRIYPREVVRRALQVGAGSLILAHNHPSGDLEPSQHDILSTRQISEAGRLFDINVVEHLIFTPNGSTSFRRRKLI